MSDDPFDGLLDLEDRFYDQGFRQGEADGQRAGQIEGRTLGLENGFKKFVEAGRLQGKTVIWANRVHPASGRTASPASSASSESPASSDVVRLPPLPQNARLQKNLRSLYALVEPGTLSTANTDEAVNDFDDRVRRAQSKARVIEKTVGELSAAPSATATPETNKPSPPR